MFRLTFIIAALCLFGVIIEAQTKTKTKCTEQIADIMFVLDSSTSIWIRNYRKQLRFVADLVDNFGVGKANPHVRVGVITFSDEAHLEFPLYNYKDPVLLKKDILGIPHRRGETNTADALRLLKEHVGPNLKTNKGPTIAIVITDGLSSGPEATVEEANKLHELGITVYAIGVGNSTMYDINELKAIASDPENGVYTVSSYSELKNIKKNFFYVCEGETTQLRDKTTTTSAPSTTTPPELPTTPSTKAPPTTTTAAPTTTTTTTAPTTNTPTTAPTTIISSTYPPTTTKKTETEPSPQVKEPQDDKPENPEKDGSSIILFGYDLISVGDYGSNMIHQFIYTLLPYTGYGHFGIVSYGHCSSNSDVKITSLKGKDLSTIKDSIVARRKIPDLAGVVRKMRKILDSRSAKFDYDENQSAVLFIDPSVTTITPELIKEIDLLKKNGVKLYLVNVGQCLRQKFGEFLPLSSQPYHNYIFSAPSYHQLLLKAQRDPHQFKSMYNQRVPSVYKHKPIYLS